MNCIHRPATRALGRFAISAAILAACGSAAAQGPPPPVLDALFPKGRETIALEALESRAIHAPRVGGKISQPGG